MSPGRLPAIVLALALAAAGGACRQYVVRPLDRVPTITSVIVFPEIIGQGDSTMITVIADDPNGDGLVYNWECDGRLLIQYGHDVAGSGFRYGSPDRSQVFYRSTRPPFNDSAYVFCTVRGGGGGYAYQRILVRLRD